MAKPNPIIKNDFSAGEVSPRLYGRVDFEDFARGLKTCKNFIPFIQGPLQTRPGTIDVAAVKTESARTRLIPFKFGTTTAYVLEFGNLYFRVYYNNSGTYTRLGTVEVTTPYATKHLQDIQFTQSNDVIYLAHPSYAPRKIIRAADDNWAITELNFVPPPTSEIKEAPSTTLTLSATSGDDVFITAGAATFIGASDEGKIITAGVGRAQITQFVSTTEAMVDIIDTFDASTYASGEWYIKGTPFASADASATGPVGDVITITADVVAFRDGSDSLPSDLGKYVYIQEGMGKIVPTQDIDTGTYGSKNKDVSAQENAPRSVSLSSDGTKAYILGSQNDTVYQYTLSTAWDISTASYASKNKDISSEETGGTPHALAFSPNGTKMYVAGADNKVFQYTLSTAWDVSTASYDSKSKDVSAQVSTAMGVEFRPDGKAMYVLSLTDTTVYQYTLSTAWDVSTATYASKSLDASAQEITMADLRFNGVGTRLYTCGYTGDKVYQYNLTTAWDVSTATYASKSLDISGEEGTVAGLAFNDEGTTVYIVGIGNDTIYQYELGSATVVNLEVLKELSSHAATYDWTLEQPIWNSTDGYPSTVTFHQDRLIWAGSTGFPQTIAASVTGDYENHARGTNDNEAFLITLNAREVNTIEWILSRQDLIVGTTEAEWAIQSSTGLLTPSDIAARLQTAYGSKSLRPAVIDGSILFFQRLGRKLRELTFDFNVSGYTAPEMSLISEHITKGGMEELSYQQSPMSILWMVRSDGQMVGFTFDKRARAIAWHRHVLGGAFDSGDAVVESVASIPHPSGDYDELWMVVKREIDSATSRRIEVMTKIIDDPDSNPEDYWQLDSGKTFTSVGATSTITGLSAWEGETLAVVDKTNGGYLGSFIVNSGEISLGSTTVTSAITGYLFNSDMEILQTAVNAPALGQGQRHRFSRANIQFYKSMAGQIGPDLTDLKSLVMKSTGGQYSVPSDTDLADPPDLVSDWRGQSVGGSFVFGGELAIRQHRPFPMTILSIVLEDDIKSGSTG
jgi:sugar lactone lactonase YvrE